MTLEQIQEVISAEIKKLDWNIEPRALFEPIEYTLLQEGKRVRPMLTLMGSYLFSSEVKDAIPAALAIEVFHNFTLLHDDLMDKADTRRGEATVHAKWGENTAILSGDVMLIKAYQLLSKVPEKHLKISLDLFSKMACEICEGQQYDMNFEKRQDVTTEEYLNMIRLKTAVLLGNALKIGAIIGGANNKDSEALYNYGINIGLAFQLKDDLLDVYGDPAVFGKKIGGDILCNKKTYLLITALEKAEDKVKKELLHWISSEDFDPEEKIKAVTEIYDKLGVKEICEEKISSFHEKSLENIKNLAVNFGFKENFVNLAASLVKRVV